MWTKRWWDDVALGREQRHPRPMRVPTLALVEQDGQAPNDPELPILFHEDRWICHLPPLVLIERQHCVVKAERSRRVEPAHADVLGRVILELRIKSRQHLEAIPHS